VLAGVHRATACGTTKLLDGAGDGRETMSIDEFMAAADKLKAANITPCGAT
jgi:hypothetical protein